MHNFLGRVSSLLFSRLKLRLISRKANPYFSDLLRRPSDLVLPSDGSEESRESVKNESGNPGRQNISPVIRDSTRRAEVFFGRTDTTDKGVNGFKQYWAAGKSYTYYKYIVLCKRSPNPSFYNLQPPILTRDTSQANAKSVFTQ